MVFKLKWQLKKVDGGNTSQNWNYLLTSEDASWKLIDGAELFFKGATISNDLFKDISKYLVDVKRQEIQT